MALQDHFHPPLSTRRHWHAFHNAWATYIASDLNHRLPEGYFAEPNVQFGIEIDVATFEESLAGESNYLPKNAGQENSLPWEPPIPNQTVPFQPVSEAVEINIFHEEAGPILAGAIELVSPANKDRPSNRSTFVSKCEGYLQQGLGLIIVDVVTVRTANLHNELLANIVTAKVPLMNASLYTTAYQVAKHHTKSCLDIWQQPLEIGQTLPIMPLWLRGAICLPIDLGSIYELTCQEQRIRTKR